VRTTVPARLGPDRLRQAAPHRTNGLRRDGFMRLLRCPCLDATGSDAAVAERYMSALRLGENPVLAKPQATTTLLAQIVVETVLWICRACKRHYRPF